MEKHSQTTSGLRESTRSSERFGQTAPLRQRRAIRPPRCAVRDTPIFVDRGRRWLATFSAVVLCIVALALWWAMLAVAFTGGTSGADPPLADRGTLDHPVYETQAVGGPPG